MPRDDTDRNACSKRLSSSNGTTVICREGGRIIVQTFLNNEGDAGSPQITVYGATSRASTSQFDLPGAEPAIALIAVIGSS
jgi:hypothetical protein